MATECTSLRALHSENIEQKRNDKLSKINFLLFLTINSVTTGVRELNITSQMSLPIMQRYASDLKSSQVKILFWTPNRGMRIQHTIK